MFIFNRILLELEKIVLLLNIFRTKANPLHFHLDYLDPILYQEHIQLPNGHYKYGYESNNAIAQQVHDPDGTAKGFYSFVDDQGKIQRVEYIAGHDGFKILGSNSVPVYTPEVEAARKAHEEAYQAARKRALEAQRAAVHNSVLTSPFIQAAKIEQAVKDTLKSQAKTILEAQQRHYNNILNGLAEQSKIFDDINLFSGAPINRPKNSNTHIHHRLSENPFIPTTTARPVNDYLETKRFVLPTPTVHHYQKIWPLPPLKFVDLAIEVNGENRYDPRVQYNHWNNGHYSQFPAQNIIPVQQSTTLIPKSETATFPANVLNSNQVKIPIKEPTYSEVNLNNKSRNRFVGIDDPIGESHMQAIQDDSFTKAQKAFEIALNNFKTRHNLS